MERRIKLILALKFIRFHYQKLQYYSHILKVLMPWKKVKLVWTASCYVFLICFPNCINLHDHLKWNNHNFCCQPNNAFLLFDSIIQPVLVLCLIMSIVCELASGQNPAKLWRHENHWFFICAIIYIFAPVIPEFNHIKNLSGRILYTATKTIVCISSQSFCRKTMNDPVATNKHHFPTMLSIKTIWNRHEGRKVTLTPGDRVHLSLV